MIVPRDDIDRLMAVMEASFDPHFGEAWTRRQVEDAMLMGNCNYFLVDQSGSAAGQERAAGFYLSRTGVEEEELLLLAVLPALRGRGLGRILLEDLIRSAVSRGARQVFLEMRRGNPAESLYRSFGFKPVGERSDYYRTTNGDRIDAITFRIDIA